MVVFLFQSRFLLSPACEGLQQAVAAGGGTRRWNKAVVRTAWTASRAATRWNSRGNSVSKAFSALPAVTKSCILHHGERLWEEKDGGVFFCCFIFLSGLKTAQSAALIRGDAGGYGWMHSLTASHKLKAALFHSKTRENTVFSLFWHARPERGEKGREKPFFTVASSRVAQCRNNAPSSGVSAA